MLSRRIKELRIAKGLSQNKLGQFLGVSQQAVGKWETGNSEPDSAMLLRLSTFFQVSVDYLLGNDSSGQPVYDYRIKKLSPDKKRILDTILTEFERTDNELTAVGK